MTEQQRDAIGAARDLTASLDGVRQELSDAQAEWRASDERLTAYGKRNRRLVRIANVAVAVVLAVAVTVALTGVYSNHSTNVSSCQASNATRGSEVALWDHLAAISKPPAHATAAQKRADRVEIAGLLAYIRRTFAPRDCAEIYRLPWPASWLP